MNTARCAHCRRTFVPDPVERPSLCDECMDRAVYGEECYWCHEVPSPRRSCR